MSGTAATDPAALEIDVVVKPAEGDYTLVPSDPRTVFLGGLFFLACLAALYMAAEIILPVVLAIVLKLLLQPVVRLGERLHLPRIVGAVVAVLGLVALLGAFGYALSGPAEAWVAKIPAVMPQLRARMHFLAMPLDSLSHVLGQLQDGAAATAPPAAGTAVRAPGLYDTLFNSTKALAAGFFTMVVVLLYLLVSGETFLRRFVEILPRFGDKRRAVEISMHIERDISAYLLTITVINVVVGICTAGLMLLCGVQSPLLWGVVAFTLNYIPILGWITGVATFALVGLVDLGPTGWGLAPAALYFLLHVLEGETITPFLLARRFTINPVVVILSLVFWYWMWGIPGAVLAVPMLAIAKIVCDDTPSLRAFGHFLES